MIATCTEAICWSSSNRPELTMFGCVNTEPSDGWNKLSVDTGGRSPGNTRYRAVAPDVEVSCWPAVSKAYAVTS